MTRKERRTLHWSLTPLVAKSGVAPLGIARANPTRAESSVVSWCSACRNRVVCRVTGAGFVAMDVSINSCVSSLAET